MAKGEAGRWEAELEDFAKESFEADGKRRDIFRTGSGPAVIVISEMPGITPAGRPVRAAGGGRGLHGGPAGTLRRPGAPRHGRLRAAVAGARLRFRGSSRPSP